MIVFFSPGGHTTGNIKVRIFPIFYSISTGGFVQIYSKIFFISLLDDIWIYYTHHILNEYNLILNGNLNLLKLNCAFKVMKAYAYWYSKTVHYFRYPFICTFPFSLHHSFVSINTNQSLLLTPVMMWIHWFINTTPV